MIGFNIVLVHPEIPQNTGNIGRLCVNTDSTLHLIKPFSFSLEDRYLKRAGLDYWPYLNLILHDSMKDFLSRYRNENLFFFSTKGKKSLWSAKYPRGSFLIFGNESSGFPKEIYRDFSESLYKIPMPGEHARSMNLANAVSVALYEAIRQNQIS